MEIVTPVDLPYRQGLCNNLFLKKCKRNDILPPIKNIISLMYLYTSSVAINPSSRQLVISMDKN
jgi:hypothetical protein